MNDIITFQRVSFTLSALTPMEFLKSRLNPQEFGFICACDSRTLYLTKKDQRLKEAYSRSRAVIPDGRPIFDIMSSSVKDCLHITGPDLFFGALSDKRISRLRHFFIGGPASLMDKIIERSSLADVNVVGSLTPPFTDIDEYNWQEIISEIKLSRADIIWVGLGAPKQEYFMLKLSNHLDRGLAIGVGLAFDQYAGNVKRAPKIFSRLSLEWLYRYSQQPMRIKRFIRPALSILPYFFLAQISRHLKKFLPRSVKS